MFNVLGIIVLLSTSSASRRGETRLPALQFGELVNQFSPRHFTPPFQSQVHPLMMALFQEKHGSLVSSSRSTRHSVRNDLSNKEKKALRRSNTVRSLACLGKLGLLLLPFIFQTDAIGDNFNISRNFYIIFPTNLIVSYDGKIADGVVYFVFGYIRISVIVYVVLLFCCCYNNFKLILISLPSTQTLIAY